MTARATSANTLDIHHRVDVLRTVATSSFVPLLLAWALQAAAATPTKAHDDACPNQHAPSSTDARLHADAREALPCSNGNDAIGDQARFETRPASRDIFGVALLYPNATAGAARWTSAHWANGHARTLRAHDLDPDDATGWSQGRGDGALRIDGRGRLRLEGKAPRLYLGGSPRPSWLNVEVTAYYRRLGTDGAANGGLVLGVRSTPEGHTRAHRYCDARTYYAAFRHDGLVTVVKELKHPQATAGLSRPLWDGAALPSDRWIGMKLVAYNAQNGKHVRLEVYRDLTAGHRGGRWESVATLLDDGHWKSKADGCPYAPTDVIVDGGGAVLIRNSNIRGAEYKWVSVREIQPPAR